MGVVLPHHANSGLLLPGQIRSIPAPYFAVPNGLVGYWGFDTDCVSAASAFDLSGNNNLGAFTGSPVLLGAGQIGQAVSFASVSQFMTISDAASWFPVAKGSVSLWFNPTWNGTDGVAHNLFSIFNLSPLNQLTCVKFTDNNWYFGWDQTSNDYRIVVPSSSIPTFSGIWYMITFTWTNSVINSVYFNGKFVGSAALGTIASVFSGASFLVGAFYNGTTSSPSNASIDDVRVYNRALDAGEINVLYQAGLAGQRHSSIDGIPGDAEMDALFLAQQAAALAALSALKVKSLVGWTGAVPLIGRATSDAMAKAQTGAAAKLKAQGQIEAKAKTGIAGTLSFAARAVLATKASAIMTAGTSLKAILGAGKTMFAALGALSNVFAISFSPVKKRTRSRMYAGRDFPNCDVGEVITYFFDFTNDLASDETLAGATFVASVAFDSEVPDPNAANIISGPAAITGNIAGQRFSGMVGGVKYLIEATVMTDQGNTLSLWSHVYCGVPF